MLATAPNEDVWNFTCIHFLDYNNILFCPYLKYSLEICKLSAALNWLRFLPVRLQCHSQLSKFPCELCTNSYQSITNINWAPAAQDSPLVADIGLTDHVNWADNYLRDKCESDENRKEIILILLRGMDPFTWGLVLLAAILFYVSTRCSSLCI